MTHYAINFITQLLSNFYPTLGSFASASINSTGLSVSCSFTTTQVTGGSHGFGLRIFNSSNTASYAWQDRFPAYILSQ